MKHILIVLLVGFAVVANGNDVGRLHQIYNDEMAGLSRLYGDQVQELQSAYLQDLNQTAEQFRKLGDLQAYVAQKAVIKEFVAKPSFTRKGAEEYQKRRDAFDLVRATKVVQLVDTYTTYLEKEKAKLTIANDIDGALRIQKVIDSVKLTGVYTGALKLVAQNEKQRAKLLPANADKPLVLRPRDAIRFGNHWYKAYHERISWDAAKKRCEELGGHLVTISNAGENAFILKLIGNARSSAYWMGLTDGVKEGEWKWVTGERSSFTNWTPGEPNGGTVAQCATMWCLSGTWDDTRVDGHTWCIKGFVCEWDK